MVDWEARYPNLVEMLESRAKQSPGKIAYTFLNHEKGEREEVNLTYQEVYDQARAIAVFLKERGLKKGDRVIIFSSQTYDNIYSIFGALFAEAVFTLIPPPIDSSKKQRFKSVLESSDASFILCNDLIANKLEDSLFPHYIPKALMRWIVKRQKHLEIFNVEKFKRKPDQWVKPNITKETLAYLQYSSGSTSSPKGVIIHHDNVIHNMEAIFRYLGDEIPKTFVAWAPLFHNMGLLSLVFVPVYIDARSVILSPLAFMEKPLRWLEAISHYKGDLILAPNSAYDFCTRVVDDADLKGIDMSTVKYAANGSEPIHFDIMKNFAEKFGKCGFKMSAFCPGYGLAESTCFVSVARFHPECRFIDYEGMKNNQFIESTDESSVRKQVVSLGKILEGMRAIIVNPNTGKPCPEWEIGEIWLQSDSVAPGYWNMNEETQQVFKGVAANHEGFFLKTGDLGAVYQGNLYIVGRLKELIIMNGHNIIPHDIEVNLKSSIPSLQASSIISFSVQVGKKEGLITCVEIPENASGDLGILAGRINRAIYSTFEFAPHDIVFVREGSLPRTDNKKIQILKARELYEAENLEMIYHTKDSTGGMELENKMVKPVGEMEEKIVQLITRAVGIDFEIGMEDNFFDVGGDSLALVQLAALLGKEFDIEMPIKYLLDHPTAQDIAKYIKRYRTGNTNFMDEISEKSLYDECRLDESINPAEYEPSREYKPENILITGATGFLGAYLIHDLMEYTNARIYCHVRGKEEKEAYLRIKNNMMYYEIWKDQYSQRLIPVLGDLTKPLLGLEEGTFNKLSGIIDTIYHGGALLNFIYPYRYLKGTNVDGTAECLRFACRNKPKYFHYISTYSVFDNPSHFKRVAYENDPLESSKGYYLGYSESKWVAEKLVRIAEKRGLRITIYRPGEITGSAGTGIWKMNDLISRFIVSAVQMEMVPDIHVNIHMIPVDFASRAIVHLSLQKESLGKAFHLLNKKGITLKEVTEILHSFGYKVKLSAFETWKEELARADQENALKPLESLFTEVKPENESIWRRYGDMEPIFDRSNTVEGLEGADLDPALSSRELFSKYLMHFTKMKYIKKAEIRG